MDDNKIKIKINLNGEELSLTSEKDNEEDIRAAAKRVNVSLDQARKTLGEISENRLLALVAYHHALSSIRAEKEGNPKQFLHKLEEWDDLLEEKILSDYTDDIAFVGKKNTP